MAKYAIYDPTENVIFTDFTGLIITQEVMAAILQDTVAVALTLLPNKVYVLACWENVQMAMDGNTYGEYVGELLQHVKGVVRYGANNLLVNVTIRNQTVKHHFQNTQSHLYKTRAEALEVLHKLEEAGS
jgi:hypothetical protein